MPRGYELETNALLARFTSEPSAQRKRLIDDLVVALKAAGVWSKLDSLYLMAGHDAQAARRNWIADQYNLTTVASPTFTTDRGYTTNGSSSYLDTGFNPATAGGKFAQDSACFAAWNRTAGQNNSSAAGWFDGADGVSLLFRTTGNLGGGRLNQAATASTSITDGTGLLALNRSGSSTSQIIKNGIQLATPTNASAALNSATLNFGRVTAAAFAAHEFAAGYLGQSMSVAEHLGAYTAINAYLVAVGAS